MRFLSSFAFAGLFVFSLQADEAAPAKSINKSVEQPKYHQSREFLPELRIAYFYPTSEKFRKIYHTGILYSAEFSFEAWKRLYPFANVGYSHLSGHSSGGHYKTLVTYVPFSLGLKYMYRVSWIDFYLGLGVLGAYVHNENESAYVTRTIKRWGVGGIAKAGFLAYATDNFFFDFFVDYTYLQIDYNSHRNNLSPHKADFNNVASGVGLGYRF